MDGPSQPLSAGVSLVPGPLGTGPPLALFEKPCSASSIQVAGVRGGAYRLVPGGINQAE